jgi:thymidine kinase
VPAPFSGDTIVIGALDSYEARCRACYEPGDEASLAARAAHSVRV